PLRYHVRGEQRTVNGPFEGVIPGLRRRLEETTDEHARAEIDQYMTPRTCPACNGARLRPEVLAVTVARHNIAEVAALPVGVAGEWAASLLEDKETSRQADKEPGADDEISPAPLLLFSLSEGLTRR